MTKKKRKRTGYFYEEEEQAFRDFLLSECQTERDAIFREKLYIPFTKMIESIIHRYDLYIPDETFSDTFFDTYSFLLSKVEKFDPSKNKKAYSYCGTICKNYLIHKSIQYGKNRDRMTSYDDISYEVNEDEKYSYVLEDVSDPLKILIDDMINEIDEMLSNADVKPVLKENEIKIGIALKSLLMNWNDLFLSLGSNNFNKNSILFYLKETTLLTTKEIRDALRKFKNRYYEIKKKHY